MKIKLFKYFLFITFVLLFLPAFAIPLVFGDFCFTYFLVFLILFFIYCILFSFRFLFKQIVQMMRSIPVKFLAVYFVIELLVTIFYIVIGKSSTTALISIFMRFLLYVMPFTLSFILAKNLKDILLLRFLYTILISVLLFGIFDFIINYFDIGILKSVMNFFVNRRLIMHNISELKATANGLPRMQSVFEEPCHLACFINLFLPMIYKISFSKFKIYKNNFIDKIVKIIVPIIAWIDIIGTQSPIYLIIAIIISAIYINLNKLKHLKFNSITFALILFFLTLIFGLYKFIINAENLSGTFLYRIQITLSALQNVNNLILAEQSLGRRIIDIVNMVQIFKQNICFGCGFGNLAISLAKQIPKSPVVLVPEVVRALNNHKYYLPTPNIFFSTLAETGLVGVFLLYSFFISVFLSLSKLLKNAIHMNSILVYSLKHFVLLYIILSFYDSQLYFPYGLAMLGVSVGYYYRVKERFKHENTNR